MIRVDARLAEVALAGFAERPFLGDDPPQRSVIVEWQKWIDAAGSPHLELRLTRGPKAAGRLSVLLKVLGSGCRVDSQKHRWPPDADLR